LIMKPLSECLRELTNNKWTGKLFLHFHKGAMTKISKEKEEKGVYLDQEWNGRGQWNEEKRVKL